jgi:hypothetical protein
MARFKSRHVRPAKAAADSAANVAPEVKAMGWNTLEELQYMVTANGCTKAQFEHAIETVGTDPHRVASYLQRYEFVRALPGKIDAT